MLPTRVSEPGSLPENATCPLARPHDAVRLRVSCVSLRGQGMPTRGAKGAKWGERKRKSIRRQRASSSVRLTSERWYAEAARAVGISTRDPNRRTATGPNALPP